MGGKPTTPIIIENGLDSNTFMLINCDGTNVTLKKDILDSLAKDYKISLDAYKNFPSKCRALRKAIKMDNDKKLKDIYAQRPDISINLFEEKQCNDFARNYTSKEWQDFYSKNKGYFQAWDDIIIPDLNGSELWNIDGLCSSMRDALISQGLVIGNDTEKSRFENLNAQIKNAREIDANMKIEEIKQGLLEKSTV